MRRAKKFAKVRPLTRDFRVTIQECLKSDKKFARAMLAEAGTLMLNDDWSTARFVLREIVNATIGFEALAAAVGKPSKSLHRMLTANGNPRMDNLGAIFNALRKKLKVNIEVRSTDLRARRRKAS